MPSYELPHNLAGQIERLCTARPHLQGVLSAFGPLIEARYRWLSTVVVDPAPPQIDGYRFSQGIAWLEQNPELAFDGQWQQAGEMVARAIGRGFPQLSAEMAELCAQIDGGSLDVAALFAAKDDSAAWSDNGQRGKVSEIGRHFFTTWLQRFILAGLARNAAAHKIFADLSWPKGHCPVCGSLPHLAILRDKGHRWLQCPDCGHEWRFSRLTCPCCEHQNPEDTGIFFIEGVKEESAVICGQCQRYLLTVNRSESLQQEPVELTALSLGHLDVILQEKGYAPMVQCEWNNVLDVAPSPLPGDGDSNPAKNCSQKS